MVTWKALLLALQYGDLSHFVHLVKPRRDEAKLKPHRLRLGGEILSSHAVADAFHSSSGSHNVAVVSSVGVRGDG